MDLIDGLKAFIATAQSGSFTEAAERLGISNRLTSKYVAELELRIGARLLQRTTRKVGLTPTGQNLLSRAPALINELEDMLEAVSQETNGISGVIRISAPVTFGEMYIQGLLSRFAARHPELDIDLRLNDTHIDLAAEGFDLAFRIGTPQVSSLKARKLGEINSLIVASPNYLSTHSIPKTPEDLKEHVCIVDTNRRDAMQWVFLEDNKEISISPSRRYRVNSARVARDWAVAGCGVALCPDFVLTKDIAEGKLIPLLDNYQSHPHPINAIYLEGKVLPLKVRALIDFALEDLQTR